MRKTQIWLLLITCAVGENINLRAQGTLDTDTSITSPPAPPFTISTPILYIALPNLAVVLYQKAISRPGRAIALTRRHVGGLVLEGGAIAPTTSPHIATGSRGSVEDYRLSNGLTPKAVKTLLLE
jgi:hypothetical protein